MAEHHLDCRNLKCPMPIVQVALRLRQLTIGDDLIVQATDPAFLVDMQAWARMTGQQLGHVVELDRVQAPSPAPRIGPPAADGHIDLADRAAGCSRPYAGTSTLKSANTLFVCGR